MTGRLHPDDVEAIACRVADELVARGLARQWDEAHLPVARRGLVDAVTLASELGMSRSWVYENRGALGAVQVGDGKKPRLRFNLDVALAAFRAIENKPRAAAQPPKQAPRRRPRGTTTVPLLPIRGEKAT